MPADALSRKFRDDREEAAEQEGQGQRWRVQAGQSLPSSGAAHLTALQAAMEPSGSAGAAAAAPKKSKSMPRPGSAALVQQQDFRVSYRLTQSMGGKGAASGAAAAAAAGCDASQGLLLPAPKFSTEQPRRGGTSRA